MIPYLDRDLLRTFFLTFFFLMAFMMVALFITSLLEIYDLLDSSKIGAFLLMYVYKMPRNIAYTLPIVTSLSILWTYTIKARNNELLAYLVGGMSPFRIAAPMLFVSAFLMIANWMVTEFLAVQGDRVARRIERIYIEGRATESLSREKDVFQRGSLPTRFYYVAQFLPSQDRMEQPLVIHLDESWSHPMWRLDAQYAKAIRIDGKSHWAFYDAVYREFDEGGVQTAYLRLDRILDDELKPPLEEELERYVRQHFRPEQMSTAELIEYIGLFEEQNRDNSKLRTILHFNFGLALGTFTMALVMCGHIIRPRDGGVVFGLGSGLFLMALFFLLLVFGRQFSSEGAALPLINAYGPIIGAYGPNVIYLALGVVFLARSRSS